MANLNLNQLRKHIQAFKFVEFFNELGWSNPTSTRETTLENGLRYKQIAELSGVVILEIIANEMPDAKTRLALHDKISPIHAEHVLIFVDSPRSQSCFFWMKREGSKNYPRTHFYFKEQSGELLLSKLSAMNVDFSELDNDGTIAIVDVAKRLKNALDIEPITKKFFKDFEQKHGDFINEIHGIDNEKDRAWYASVLLHRLMFIWFLQKKGFVDKGNLNYLTDKLSQIQTHGADLFYRDFLKRLFFEGFAKPKNERSAETNKLLGDVRYLNGGLFLPHVVEEKFSAIHVNDKAFSDLFDLFGKYSWNLNDTIGGADNEINPDVLGYIFEKYINQKAFGAYYTRPEITDYLCERTISKLILDRINTPAIPELNLLARQFKDLPELLFKLDAPLCRKLLLDILPNLSLLDPACGSGAFLVAAMKTLINVYSAIIGKIEFLNDDGLSQWLKSKKLDHPNIHYFIKKEIIKNNLFGVDIMPEATEIAKLRLFLALVSSAQKVDDLEPLPNIDFNIMAGNSLIGLLNVEGEKFNQLNKSADLFKKFGDEGQTYQQILQEKNRLVTDYREKSDYVDNLVDLRDVILKKKEAHYQKLNALLLAEFERLQIKYEQATWDDAKNKEAKPIKRAVTLADISTLQPFHWGYEFDQIFSNGGFDAIITNPPWEVLKPQAKEFFADYSELVTKNKMTIKDFEKEQKVLLAQPETRAAWLDYQSRFPFLSLYFRASSQYPHQTAVVNGKKTGSDINLYKLFTEQCFNLLKPNGECGIVIPSGIYTDLGATGLRHLLFNQTHITGLFCFENRKTIFEGVHRSFKFVVLTFEKSGISSKFPAAFMRHEVSELTDFPNSDSLQISTDLIKKLSPDSQSIMEFKNETDIKIAEKMLAFPLLGEQLENTWNLKLSNEFHMTNDSHLFKTENAIGRLPLFEGKMIHQFSSTWGEPKYWVDEAEGRKGVLGLRKEDVGQILDYQCYRLAHRAIARNTDMRTMIASVIPQNVFYGHSLNASTGIIEPINLLYIVAILNSFVFDYSLRQRVTANLTMFYIYQSTIPRLTESDARFKPIVERAAALICVTDEFEDLKRELIEKGYELKTDTPDVLRAELDAMVAHLYNLTEAEFAHILKTFPIVKDEAKVAAMVEFLKLEALR